MHRQSVLYLKVHESKVKNDFKAAANVEKPRQLFWEKRLNGKNLAFLLNTLRFLWERWYVTPFSKQPKTSMLRSGSQKCGS